MLSQATTSSLQHSFGTSFKMCIKKATSINATWVGLSLVQRGANFLMMPPPLIITNIPLMRRWRHCLVPVSLLHCGPPSTSKSAMLQKENKIIALSYKTKQNNFVQDSYTLYTGNDIKAISQHLICSEQPYIPLIVTGNFCFYLTGMQKVEGKNPPKQQKLNKIPKQLDFLPGARCKVKLFPGPQEHWYWKQFERTFL